MGRSCSAPEDPTAIERRKLLLYPRAKSQAGERGKKPNDRFWMRNLRLRSRLLCPRLPSRVQQGGWEPGLGAAEQLARSESSVVLEQSTSWANEHRSLPCKRDLTHPAQAWGIQREPQAARASGGRGGSSSWAGSGEQPLLTVEAVRG